MAVQQITKPLPPRLATTWDLATVVDPGGASEVRAQVETLALMRKEEEGTAKSVPWDTNKSEVRMLGEIICSPLTWSYYTDWCHYLLPPGKILPNLSCIYWPLTALQTLVSETLVTTPTPKAPILWVENQGQVDLVGEEVHDIH